MLPVEYNFLAIDMAFSAGFSSFLGKRTMNINAVPIAWTFYGVFLILAILGFISDSLSIERAFLGTNTILNFTHLITAIGFAVVSKQVVSRSIQFIRVMGMAYMMISLIGFMGISILIDEQWEDVIYLNLLSYLQFGLGVILSILGSILNNRQRLIAS